MNKTTNLFDLENSLRGSLSRCVCGRPISKGRLCGECYSSVPDFIREQFLSGNDSQRENATRWFKASASQRLTVD